MSLCLDFPAIYSAFISPYKELLEIKLSCYLEFSQINKRVIFLVLHGIFKDALQLKSMIILRVITIL